MVLIKSVILVVAAAALAGATVLIPRTPTVPLDRRRPYRTESDSQLTRFAGSAVELIERFLAKRNVRFFNREALENAGLRLSQADFLFLVIISSFVGGLVGLVVAGPLLAILLMLAPCMLTAPARAQLIEDANLPATTTVQTTDSVDDPVVDRWWGVVGGVMCGFELRLIRTAPEIGLNPYVMAAGLGGCLLGLLDVMTTQ